MTATRLALINGRAVLPDRIVTGLALMVADGHIAGLARPADLGADITTFDAGGRYITPGLVDIHTHGALHHTFNEPDPVAWRAITEENLRRGTTALLATFAPTPNLAEGLDFCREWMATVRGGAQVLGAYLESPYINIAQKGALDASCVRTADDGSAGALLAYADILRVFMLAPELPGAQELIALLNAVGVIPAAGHSNGARHGHAGRDAGRAAPRDAPVERDVQRGARGAVAQTGRARSGADVRWADRRNHRR